MGRIKYDSFKRYALKLLRDGVPVCPCCLWPGLEFTTDDDHEEYWLECRKCHIGRHDAVFSHISQSWRHRALDDLRIRTLTHDIQCEWWDDDSQDNIYITARDLEEPENEPC